MRTLIGLSLVLMVAACGDKKPVEGPVEAAPAKITAPMPDTSEAKEFAERLVALTIEDWDPISANSGAELTYKRFVFLPDGAWEADGLMKASYEEFECKEVGKWSIDSIDEPDTATMDWQLIKTTCPMREPGTQRVKMTIQKGGTYKILFR